MSTRGNYVFIDYPYKEDKDGNWVQDPEQIIELKKGISNESSLIKEGYKVYIHSDNYPSYALPRLFNFLSYPASLARATDPSYLSAWFIADKCVNDLLKYGLAFCRDEISVFDESYSKFLNEYDSRGKDIGELEDFTGVGLENSISDWADYTYVILADTHIEGSIIKPDGFRIFIFDYKLNFIDEIHSTDDLEELKEEDWWN